MDIHDPIPSVGAFLNIICLGISWRNEQRKTKSPWELHHERASSTHRKSLPPFSPPASKFSYEEMINCHDSRGKGIVFLLLVIYFGLSSCCNFENDPISDEYMKKIDAMLQYIPHDYQVERLRITSEEKKDQNCFHLLTLFISNITLATIRRWHGSEFNRMITSILNEFHFIGECSFKIPSTCTNENVAIYTLLTNLNASLKALKPNIENNFTHCLHLTCASVEQTSTMKNTVTTRRNNNGQQNSTANELSEEQTTPTVKFNNSSSEHLVNSSNRTRNHRLPIIIICSLIIICVIIVFIIWRN
ncbi:fms-related tyrosine kinase 3 ligand isoform X2 [Eleutherodactylus coqui]|uniref:fms-related tyrosine kinase 3 ligand isoform X2 n=1 Tax=Eleutherodactylus coqui TaxID=57060 RepID=UPI0034627D91